MATGASMFAQGRTLVSGSGAVTATNHTVNLRTAPTLHDYVPLAEAVDLYLVVTANSGTPGNSSWVEFQTSPDGGTTWVTATRFSQITGSTAEQRVSVRTVGLGGNEAAAASGAMINTVTAAVTQNFVLTQDQRVKWTIGTGMSLTFSVFAVPQPIGSRSNC
jgi:hypothetical protein